MIKGLVLAMHIHQFINFCRELHLNPSEYKYVRNWNDTRGWRWDMPIIILEEYKYNTDYTLYLMQCMRLRFENITFISEGERWNDENIII